MRRWRGLLISCVLVAGLVPGAGAAADETDVGGLLSRINAIRAEHHLRPLRARPSLEICAGAHTRYLDGIHALRHDSADGTPAPTRIRRAYRARIVGEVLAYGPSTAWIVRAWMRSPTHRALLLDRSFRSIGIGIVHDGDTFWVTADLGS